MTRIKRMMADFGLVCQLLVVLPTATKSKSKDVSELFVCVGKGLSTFFLEKGENKICTFILWLTCSFVTCIKMSLSIKCCSKTLREKLCEAAVMCWCFSSFWSIVFRLEDYVFEALAYIFMRHKISNALLSFFPHNSVRKITGKCRNKICIPFHKNQFEVCLYFHNGILYLFIS